MTLDRKGIDLIERALAVARAAKHEDAPFPLDEREAGIWHEARVNAFNYCLEMLNVPAPSGQAPLEGVKPLDLANVLKHAFLSGVVAARSIPAGDECDGPKLWTEYEPYEPGSYQRIRSAFAAQPVEHKLREALKAMLAHSCVADSAAEDKDEEDHAAERLARSALLPASAEPVAWMFELANARNNETHEPCNWGEPRLSFTPPSAGKYQRNVTPLYASPPASGAVEAAIARLWPNGFGPKNLAELAAFVEEERKCETEYRYAMSGGGAVDAGWQLVPKEPTEEMMDAFATIKPSSNIQDATRVWNAMLSTAPREGR